jgi:hypothetical protein
LPVVRASIGKLPVLRVSIGKLPVVRVSIGKLPVVCHRRYLDFTHCQALHVKPA